MGNDKEQEKNGVSKFETTQEFDKSLQDFKDNFRSLTKSMFDLTSESINVFNNSTKDLTENWFFENKEDDGELKNTIKRVLNRNNEMWEFPGVYESHMNHFHKHFGFPNINRHLAQKFGLMSHSAPSVRNYNDCRDKNGQQVWDSNGNWRCLFPNAEIPNKLMDFKQQYMHDQILTKEDFQQALRDHNYSNLEKKLDFGERGIFFNQFEDFMDWKSTMYKNLKQQRREMRRSMRESCKRPKEAEISPASKSSNEVSNKSYGYTSNNDTNSERSVVSQSVSTDYSSNSDNDTIYRETKTEYFSDGTSITTSVTKTKPLGTNEWKVSETVETDDNAKSKGWFWN